MADNEAAFEDLDSSTALEELRQAYAQLQLEFQEFSAASQEIETELERALAESQAENDRLRAQIQVDGTPKATTAVVERCHDGHSAKNTSAWGPLEGIGADIAAFCGQLAADSSVDTSKQLADARDLLERIHRVIKPVARRECEPDPSGPWSTAVELELRACQQQRDALLVALVTADAAIGELSAQADDMRKSISQLGTTLDATSMQYAEMQHAFTGLQREHGEMVTSHDKALQAREQIERDLRIEYETAATAAAALKTRAVGLQMELDVAHEEVAALNAEIVSLREAAVRHQSAAKEADMRADRLQQKVAQLQQQLQHAQQQLKLPPTRRKQASVSSSVATMHASPRAKQRTLSASSDFVDGDPVSASEVDSADASPSLSPSTPGAAVVAMDGFPARSAALAPVQAILLAAKHAASELDEISTVLDDGVAGGGAVAPAYDAQPALRLSAVAAKLRDALRAVDTASAVSAVIAAAPPAIAALPPLPASVPSSSAPTTPLPTHTVVGMIPAQSALISPRSSNGLAAKYEALLRENSQLLSSLFKSRTNIMVFCRVRPPTQEELRYGGVPPMHSAASAELLLSSPDMSASVPDADDAAAGGAAAATASSADAGVAAGAALSGALSPVGKLGITPTLVVDVLSDSEIAFYDRARRAWRPFAFDRVFAPECSQDDVFRDVAPLAQSVVEGYNACIFAYGITGSGKTHTMQGPESDPGINMRIIGKIFELAALRRASHEFKIRVSMLEIYNEELRDLLLPVGAAPVKLEIRTAGLPSDTAMSFASPDGKSRSAHGATSMLSPGMATGVQIPLLTSLEVKSPDDVLAAFARGTLMRATAATNIHEHSSRSHCVLKVEVESSIRGASGTDDITSAISSTLGKLYLVDLAGSERVRKSAVTGARLREAQYINRSLSALGDVLEALDKKAPHIPYRNSKLTHLLQDSLGGSARTLMMATVCPGAFTADETLYSLQFASRARNIDLGPAQRTVQIKNITEQYRTLRTDFAASEHAKVALEKEVAELQRANANLEDKIATLRETSAKANDTARKALSQRLDAMKRDLVVAQEALVEEKRLRAADADAAQHVAERLKKEQHALATAERDRKILEQRILVYQREIAGLKTSLSDAKATLHRRGLVMTSQRPTPAHDDARRGSAASAKSSSHLDAPVPIPMTARPSHGGADLVDGGPATSAPSAEQPQSPSHSIATSAADSKYFVSESGARPSAAAAPVAGGSSGSTVPVPAGGGGGGAPPSKFLQAQRERRAKREAEQMASRREAEEAERRAKEELKRHAQERARAMMVSGMQATRKAPGVPGLPAKKPSGRLPYAVRAGVSSRGATGDAATGRKAASSTQTSGAPRPGHASSGSKADAYEYMPLDDGGATFNDDGDYGYSDDETAGGTFMVGILNPTDEQEASVLQSADVSVASETAHPDTDGAASASVRAAEVDAPQPQVQHAVIAHDAPAQETPDAVDAALVELSVA